MESESIELSRKDCECRCNCCDPTGHGSCTRTRFRSVKRKLDELEIETRSFLTPGVLTPGVLTPEVARVEIENECDVLREMVTNQQQSIHDLSVELEEERNASSSAANEAMSMILRLQREKAHIEMEARQFKRFSDQKTTHDQQEIAALEELLCKREQTIQSLTCEVQAYKYRMMSYGLTEAEAEGVKGVITHSNSTVTNSVTEFSHFDDYPPLKCQSNEQQTYAQSEPETIDIEKYTFNETPCSIKEEEFNFKNLDNCCEFESEVSDRIYTVDSIHYNAPAACYNDQKNDMNNMNTCDEFMSIHKDSMCYSEVQDLEVMKLYARLHALEADRESMRQAIINMRTDKAQLVLLKEIAQNLCRDMMSTSRMPVKKQSYFKSFGQSVVSLVLWRRNASQTKYMFGMTSNNPGLMVILDKGSQMGQWRCVSRTQV